MRARLQRIAIVACVTLSSVCLVLAAGGAAASGAPVSQTTQVEWNAVHDALGRPGTMMRGDVLGAVAMRHARPCSPANSSGYSVRKQAAPMPHAGESASEGAGVSGRIISGLQ